jgi:hypothetical protein
MRIFWISTIMWMLPNLLVLALSLQTEKKGPPLERYGRTFDII